MFETRSHSLVAKSHAGNKLQLYIVVVTIKINIFVKMRRDRIVRCGV